MRLIFILIHVMFPVREYMEVLRPEFFGTD